MSVLRSLESKIAGLIEGTFSRAFRSEVRPVEIARKLTREMDENRSLSLSRTYVPNEYRIYLSVRDRERFHDYEDALAAELSGYLLEHARRERLVLVGRPVIEFETDERLGLGEFGIETGVVDLRDAQEDYEPEPPPPPVDAGGTLIQSGADLRAGAAQGRALPGRRTALLVMGGRRLMLSPTGMTLGRSRQSDLLVDDPGVSRKHAELRLHGSDWVLTDLGSTNGTRLNGHQVNAPERLEPGDEIELGSTVLRFELE